MRCLLLLRLVHHLLRVHLPLRGAQLVLIRLLSMCCTLFDGRIDIGLQGRVVAAVGQFAQGFARLLIALVNLLWQFERARSSVYCPVYLLSKQQFERQRVQTFVRHCAANPTHFAPLPHQIGFSGCLIVCRHLRCGGRCMPVGWLCRCRSLFWPVVRFHRLG